MIEVYKMLNGFYDVSVTPVLQRNHATRYDDLKLIRSEYRLGTRKYNFSSRILGL